MNYEWKPVVVTSSFHKDLNETRIRVMKVFGFTFKKEANDWIIEHTGVSREDNGIVTGFTAPKEAAELIKKLAGPHGYTLIKMLDVRKHG